MCCFILIANRQLLAVAVDLKSSHFGFGKALPDFAMFLDVYWGRRAVVMGNLGLSHCWLLDGQQPGP